MTRRLHLPARFRRARRTDLVRNLWGEPLPCCWSDCTEKGSTHHQVTVPHDAPQRRDNGDTLTYVFCSPRHVGYWMSANVPGGHYGNLLSGQRSPLGLIVP